jgi:hypothetical protein
MTSSVSPTLEFLGLDRERELAEREDALGLAADVDEQFVLVFGDDDAGENLALVENLEALFVEALLERELVFFFVVSGAASRQPPQREVSVLVKWWSNFLRLCILFLAAAAPPGPALAEDRAHDGFPTSRHGSPRRP